MPQQHSEHTHTSQMHDRSRHHHGAHPHGHSHHGKPGMHGQRRQHPTALPASVRRDVWRRQKKNVG